MAGVGASLGQPGPQMLPILYNHAIKKQKEFKLKYHWKQFALQHKSEEVQWFGLHNNGAMLNTVELYILRQAQCSIYV